jgi:hypothetical protein
MKTNQLRCGKRAALYRHRVLAGGRVGESQQGCQPLTHLRNVYCLLVREACLRSIIIGF